MTSWKVVKMFNKRNKSENFEKHRRYVKMDVRKRLTGILMAACVMATSIFGWAQSADAAKLSSSDQAVAKAQKKVPNATLKDVEQDHKNGHLVYEVELVKGNKEYEFVYRASDAKLLKFEWEKKNVAPSSGKALISENKCRQLAKNKVKKGKILSVRLKRDDGVDIYKVKMAVGNKLHKLKFHARTGELVEHARKIVVAQNARVR